MADPQLCRLRARLAWLPGGQLLDNPVVEVADGRIVSLRRGSGAADHDFGDAVLLPGFVNAHVHLDLPGPTIPVGWHPTAWLRAVIAARQAAAETVPEIVRRNVAASFAGGTTFVGDIAASAASRAFRQAMGLAGIDFREVVGINPQRFRPLLQAALAAAEEPAGGLSPHAPYSTSAEAFAAAARHPAPKATHWLEFPDEAAFLRTGAGPWRDFLVGLGALDAAATHAPWPNGDAGANLRGDGGPWLLAHANFAAAEDLAGLQQAKIAGFVCCPRTRRHFGHGPYPWKLLRQHGAPIALGTDSLASNPDLSMLAELQAAILHEGLTPTEALHAATGAGAAALGQQERGELRPGAWADLVALQPDRLPANPAALDGVLLGEAQVRAVVAQGRVVFQA